MKKNRKLFFIITFAFALLLIISGCNSSTSSNSDKVYLKAATGNQHTSPYIYSAVLAEILKENTNDEVNLEVLPYTGGIGNVELVTSREADLGIMFNVSSNWAYNGIVAYDKKYENIRGLVGGLSANYIGIMASSSFVDEHDIKSLADIKEKELAVRLITNPNGSMAEYVTRLALEAHGLDYEMIESFGGSVELTSNDVVKTKFQNREVDLHIMALARNHGFISELATLVDLSFLNLDDDAFDYLEDYGFNTESIFPAEEFNGQDYEVKTPSFFVTYIVRDDMDDEIAYLLAKTISENKEELVKAHAVINEFEPSKAGFSLMNGGIPLHPGAEKYYKEVGAID